MYNRPSDGDYPDLSRTRMYFGKFSSQRSMCQSIFCLPNNNQTKSEYLRCTRGCDTSQVIQSKLCLCDANYIRARSLAHPAESKGTAAN